MDIIKKSHQNQVTKDQNAIAEKRANCPMKGNCKVNNVVYRCGISRALPKKVYLRLAERERENGTAISITTSYHLNTKDIPTRQHFLITFGT